MIICIYIAIGSYHRIISDNDTSSPINYGPCRNYAMRTYFYCSILGCDKTTPILYFASVVQYYFSVFSIAKINISKNCHKIFNNNILWNSVYL